MYGDCNAGVITQVHGYCTGITESFTFARLAAGGGEEVSMGERREYNVSVHV